MTRARRELLALSLVLIAGCKSESGQEPLPEPQPTASEIREATHAPGEPSPSAATEKAEQPATEKAEPATAQSTPALKPTSAAADKPAAQKSIGAPSPKEPAEKPAAPKTQASATREDDRERYSGADPCTTEKFSFSAVRSVCERGGRRAAKDFMKTLVKKAKASGKDTKCSSCHEDTKRFVLKPNAKRDLKELLQLL